MGRLSPRGHTEDSREVLIALTSRTSVQAVKESGLIEREGFARVGCQGESCHQVRQPCKDRCGAEMAQPELPEPFAEPLTFVDRLAQFAVRSSILVTCLFAAGAVVGFCAWVGYWLLPALAR